MSNQIEGRQQKNSQSPPRNKEAAFKKQETNPGKKSWAPEKKTGGKRGADIDEDNDKDK